MPKKIDQQDPEDRDSSDAVIEPKTSINALEAKLALAKKVIANLRDELSNLDRLLSSAAEVGEIEELMKSQKKDGQEVFFPAGDGRVVEGVFDGQQMVGSDGRQYAVPPNYASKSKLVEGDILKLTIQGNGTFLFKQIGPIERQRVVGSLVKEELTGDWRVFGNGKKYHVLTAAVSFHKGDAGDDAVILIPESAPSKWAALENVIKRS